MKKHLLTILACSVTLSCATVISGTSQAITIDSDIKGATVNFEGQNVGVTPFAGKVKRQRDAVVMVSKDGYATQTVVLTSAFNPVTVLSIFWDFSTTDLLTGACWEYAPSSYYVSLRSDGTSSAEFKESASKMAFAMTYFNDLQLEVRVGDGPLVRSFHKEYFSNQDFGTFVYTLAALGSSTAIEFGEAIAQIASV